MVFREKSIMQNKVRKRGDSYTISGQLELGGVIINLTGWTLFYTLKENLKDSDDNAKLSKAGTIGDDDTKISILIAHDDTENLLGDYYYDRQYVGPNGHPVITFSGMIKFEADVTQRVIA